MTTTPVPDDVEFVAHLRRTLHAVAETVTDNVESTVGAACESVARSRRTPARRRIAVVSATVVAALGLVAWNNLDDGEIERIPTEAALAHGSAEGFDWWLIPSEAIGHTNACGVPFPGVEMVSSATNRLGEEWNTAGVSYGTFADDCASPGSDVDGAAWLDDPTLMSVGFMRLGRDDDPASPWGAFAALHPSIDRIDVVVDDDTVVSVETVTGPGEPDGVRYAGFTIPSDVCTFRLDYLAAGVPTPVVSKESTIC